MLYSIEMVQAALDPVYNAASKRISRGARYNRSRFVEEAWLVVGRHSGLLPVCLCGDTALYSNNTSLNI